MSTRLLGSDAFRAILLLVALGTPCTAFAAEPIEFSIMTWNLEWFYDDDSSDNFSKLAKEKASPSREDWDWRRDAVAASIAKVQPTICALQEVENRRVLWYLTRAIERNHQLAYEEVCIESKDVFTEQDVGFLYRKPAQLVATTVFSLSDMMRSTKQYYDVSKHVLGTFEIPTATASDPGSEPQRVIVMNVHLRSTAEAQDIRTRQARLVHHWVSERIAAGENVIVLGDFNTETTISSSDTNTDHSLTDMAVARGLEHVDTSQHLVDLQSYLERGETQTHVLPGRSFDRILVSPSLLEDDPKHRDLVFDSVQVRRDLTIQSDLDEPQQHWDNYWNLPADERDLSDHFPVLATFKLK